MFVINPKNLSYFITYLMCLIPIVLLAFSDGKISTGYDLLIYFASFIGLIVIVLVTGMLLKDLRERQEKIVVLPTDEQKAAILTHRAMKEGNPLNVSLNNIKIDRLIHRHPHLLNDGEEYVEPIN